MLFYMFKNQLIISFKGFYTWESICDIGAFLRKVNHKVSFGTKIV